MSISALALQRYYDESYPPDILGGGGPPPTGAWLTTRPTPIPADVAVRETVPTTLAANGYFVVAGTVTKVSFWKPAGAATSHGVSIYNMDGMVLETQQASSGEAAGAGWVDVTLTAPVLIAEGGSYLICYSIAASEPYAAAVPGPPPTDENFASLGSPYAGDTASWPGSAASANFFFWLDCFFEPTAARSAPPKSRRNRKAAAVTPTPEPETAPEPMTPVEPETPDAPEPEAPEEPA